MGRKCRRGTACDLAHVRMSRGKIVMWEATEGYLSVKKPIVRPFFRASTPAMSTASRTSMRSRVSTRKAMSVRSSNSAWSSVSARASESGRESVMRWAQENAAKAKAERLAEEAERQRLAAQEAERQRLAAQEAERQRLAE